MTSNNTMTSLRFAALVLSGLFLGVHASAAQTPATAADYVVGQQDVLTITSYDQADLSGKFTVETDGTFTYPLIGRFKAGGLTLRKVEEGLKDRLKSENYFKNPADHGRHRDSTRSQKLFVVGEVGTPGRTRCRATWPDRGARARRLDAADGERGSGHRAFQRRRRG